MFDLNPDIDLSKVKDDMTNTQYGFSFLQYLDNKLADAYLDLSTKACTTCRNRLFRQGCWDWKAIFLYRKKVEAFEEMLLGGLHTTGGQLPRAPELLSLECHNGSSTEHRLYIWNGSMAYLTRHHKAKRSTNREFNVIRFLPVRLGHSLYKYLVYIRPFVEMLQREQSSFPDSAVAPSQRRLLFRSGHALDKAWDPSRLTAILKKATAEVWGQAVNAQLLRQLAIGITEKHVQEVHKPFNRYDDKGAGADMNVVFAWQSGHRPLQRATTYGLDGAFPTKLQPALLRVYEWASIRWHEFLHQPSKVMPQSREIEMIDRPRDISSTVTDQRQVQPSQTTNAKRQERTQPEVNMQPGALLEIVLGQVQSRCSEPDKKTQESPSLAPVSKRKLPSAVQDSSYIEHIRPAKQQLQSPRMQNHADTAVAGQNRPVDIVTARIDAWRRGEIHSPVSDDESDSSIDWDQPVP
jgi:hypothetical protein